MRSALRPGRAAAPAVTRRRSRPGPGRRTRADSAGAERSPTRRRPNGRPQPRCRSTSPRSARSSRTSVRCCTRRRCRSAWSGRASDLAFDPSSYFFYQDNRSAATSSRASSYYWIGERLARPCRRRIRPRRRSRCDTASTASTTRTRGCSGTSSASGGFPALYDRGLQLTAGQIDPRGADVFSFRDTYQPVHPNVCRGARTGRDPRLRQRRRIRGLQLGAVLPRRRCTSPSC